MADAHARLEVEDYDSAGPVFARSDSDEFGDALLDALGSDDDGDTQDSPVRPLFSRLCTRDAIGSPDRVFQGDPPVD